ncbi:flavodoxin domain-containing protein [Bermanella sp. R86510]|uniref:flavodoxin domain-containing protein n=1 Tax=unclassified Bermanella TaxID=2627862 RepID=UPI0037C99E8C
MLWKLSLGTTALLGIYILQMDAVEWGRKLSALVLLVAYGFVLIKAWRKQRSTMPVLTGADYIIAYATETGTARKIAYKTLKCVKRHKQAGQVIELNDLLTVPLPKKGLLVIASTSGQGDAPRTGRDWLKQGINTQKILGLPYAVLALGDRNYRQFCGFGLKVDSILRGAGGQPMLEMQMVNQANHEQINYWYKSVEQFMVSINSINEKERLTSALE